MNKATKLLATAIMASLTLGSVSTSMVVLSATQVEAKSSKSKKSERRGNSRKRQQQKGGKGKLASELKNLNAMCANENAFKNASANSNVGRIGAFYTAQNALEDAEDDYLTAGTALSASGEVYRGQTVAEIDAAIALLDPALNAGEIDALNRQRDYANASTSLVDAQTAEVDALAAAVGERTLSDEALEYFRSGCDRKA